MKETKGSKFHKSLKKEAEAFYKIVSKPGFRGNKCKKMHWWK